MNICRVGLILVLGGFPGLSALAGTLDFSNGLLAGLNGVYEDPNSSKSRLAPVVCHIDCTHPDTIWAGMKKADQGHLGYLRTLKPRIEEASGLGYVVLHYSQLDDQGLSAPCIRALVVTRIDKGLPDATPRKRLLNLLRNTSLPVLGICGGHQLLVEAHGGTISLMRKLAAGEKDLNPAYQPGILKEWGFMPVHVVKADPLFAGLKPEIMVQQFHAYEVVALPDAFELLASSECSKVQAVKHKTKPIYGTQFHPEHFEPPHMDGRVILSNFFRAVGVQAVQKN